MSKTPAIQQPTDQYARLATAVLVPSLTNRKEFDPGELQELADSIQANDVQQPLIVRILPGDRLEDTRRDTPRGKPAPTHEIVAGERRWRGAIMCGLASVPVIIRDLTDSEALDTQMLENLHRVNLTALQEGEAYAIRMAAGLTVDEVAAKIGRSREYVYSKTKLLDLCTEGKEALRTKKIDPSHALPIARIPDNKLQLKALEYATTPKPGGGGDCPSVSELKRWLHQNVLLHLDKAVFKITDAKLVEAAGSCKDCPKRTGANPDIFSDIEGKDICTDPPCFNSKTTAHRAALMARAEAKGMRVIDGAEAKKICNANSGALKGYSSLTQARHDVEGDHPAQLGKLLGKDAPAPVLIENPWTKELIEAVPTEEAESVLIAKGLIKTTSAAIAKQDKQAELDATVARLKSGMEHACNRGARQAMFTALQAAIRSTPDDKAAALVSPTLLRAWLTDRLYDLDHEDTATVLQVQLDPESYSTTDEDAARLRLQACDDATVYRATALYLMLDDRDTPSSTPASLFEALAGTTHTSLQAVRKASDKAVKAGISDQIRELTEAHKKAQKSPPPNSPLAQPGGTPPAAATPSDGAKPKLKKAKLSGEEAQLGIAEAMQGIEASALADAGKAAPAHLRNANAAAWPFPTTPTDPLAPIGGQQVDQGIKVGQMVKIKKTAESRKYRGMTGKVYSTGRDGERHLFLVSINGTNPCGFEAKDLEVIPDGNPDGTPVTAFELGQKVTVTEDESCLGLTQHRFAGKTGTITRREEGGGFWDVTFKGRTGGVSMFREEQLTQVEA
ncbi:MAG: ParB/RepB/Spo0J family partition protein [Acidovorax sp.]|nr:ParB/RepB/Spo0J family partition protein [Acidovorax sp.]